MDCSDARPLSDAILDDALDEATHAAVERHLRACPACREHYAAIRYVSDAVRRHGRAYRAPAGLAARIDGVLPSTSLPEQAPRRPRPLGRLRRLLPEITSALAGAIVAGGLTLWIASTGDRDRAADEVVAAHIRSLLADHLTDVASADQHTVKPWFSGKVDVAPPARDLTEAGFTLAGGRLDYLDGRRVAALVYRHHQHVINVFVLPDKALSDAAPQVRQYEGYNIVTWRAAGLSFTAVSDAASADLLRLASLLGTRPPGESSE